MQPVHMLVFVYTYQHYMTQVGHEHTTLCMRLVHADALHTALEADNTYNRSIVYVQLRLYFFITAQLAQVAWPI